MRFNKYSVALLFCTTFLAAFVTSDANAQLFRRSHKTCDICQACCHETASMPGFCMATPIVPADSIECGNCKIAWDETEWYELESCKDTSECYCCVIVQDPPGDLDEKRLVLDCDPVSNISNDQVFEIELDASHSNGLVSKKFRFTGRAMPGVVVNMPIKIRDEEGNDWTVSIAYGYDVANDGNVVPTETSVPVVPGPNWTTCNVKTVNGKQKSFLFDLDTPSTKTVEFYDYTISIHR